MLRKLITLSFSPYLDALNIEIFDTIANAMINNDIMIILKYLSNLI